MATWSIIASAATTLPSAKLIAKQPSHFSLIFYLVEAQIDLKHNLSSTHVLTRTHVNLSALRIWFADKTLIVWKLTRDEANYGIPQKRLYGHSHFISDVVLSSDGNYALSGSWDKTLRLWDLAAGRTTRRFEDHTKVWHFSSDVWIVNPRETNGSFFFKFFLLNATGRRVSDRKGNVLKLFFIYFFLSLINRRGGH